MRLKNCPDIVPVHAITENPIEESAPFAKRSARVFPRASNVHESTT